MIFGLDGGGTGSRLRVATETNKLVAMIKGEGVNPQAVGYGTAVDRIEGLFQRAIQDIRDRMGLSVGIPDFVAGCFAVAGGGVPEEAKKMEQLLRERIGFQCPLSFVSDAEAALVGGVKGLEGVILIAGTGSVAVGRLRDGKVVRSGGYGHYLGDEGSGFWIAHQAVARSIRHWEGRDLPTDMLTPLMEYFGIQHPHQFISYWYQRFDKAQVAGASALVEQHRQKEDPLAVDIFLKAADELYRLVESVYRRIEQSLTVKKLVLWGGLLDHNSWLKQAVVRHLHTKLPALKPQEAEEDATFGACALASRLVREVPEG